MDFIFHSVHDIDGRTKYFSVYKIDETHFRAECHHFNRARFCDGDFNLVKEGKEWKASDDKFHDEAAFIGEEIYRMEDGDHQE